jgi:hypothetical protein
VNAKRISLSGLLLVFIILTACNGPEKMEIVRQVDEKSDDQQESSSTEEVWLYVGMGDSFSKTGYSEWPRMYARFLEEKLSVKMKFIDKTIGGVEIIEMLENIRTNESLRANLMEAKLITVNFGSESFRIPNENYKNGICGGTDGQDCLREAFSRAEIDWEAFLNELISLRSPEEAPIITFMVGISLVQTTCDWGSNCCDVLTTYMIDWSDFIKQTAIERGIYVVDANKILNGQDYRQPTNKDLLRSDGFHLNTEGSTEIFKLLQELDLHEKPPLLP